MLYGHDEGKNIKQLCDGENEVVCIEMGGTGASTPEGARQALGAISDAGTAELSTTVAAGAYADLPVTFAKEFSTLPKVNISMVSSSTGAGIGRITAAILPGTLTVNGFTIRVFNSDTAARRPGVAWNAYIL